MVISIVENDSRHRQRATGISWMKNQFCQTGSKRDSWNNSPTPPAVSEPLWVRCVWQCNALFYKGHPTHKPLPVLGLGGVCHGHIVHEQFYNFFKGQKSLSTSNHTHTHAWCCCGYPFSTGWMKRIRRHGGDSWLRLCVEKSFDYYTAFHEGFLLNFNVWQSTLYLWKTF